MEQKNLTMFLDAAQRTIIGELVSDDGVKMKIKNPVVVNIIPQQGGGMGIQLPPAYFREFMGDKSQPVTFTYLKSTVTEIAFEGGFDFRLYGQYDSIVAPPVPAPAPVAPGAAAPVLKLFEE